MSFEGVHSPHGEITDEQLKEILAAHHRWLETEGAEGQRADLSDVVDLMGGRLAGANLAGAKMPPHLKRFRELIHVDHTVSIARPIYLILLILCAYTTIALFSTTDVSIISNQQIQFLPESALGIPVSGFIIIVPIILFGFYIYLHLYLYRLWQGLGSLPSVFHDGTPLDQAVSPWLATAFVRFYQSHGVQTPSLLGVAQKWVTAILIWWLAPITLILIWARYLVRHDWPVTTLHIALVVFAVWSAVILYRFALAGIRREKRPFQGVRGIASGMVLMGGIGMIVVMLSVGAFDATRKEFTAKEPRTWIAGALHLLGMRPCANLARAQLSTNGTNYGEPGPLDLSNSNLRCANFRSATLVRADLSHAELRGTDFSEAVLNGADLSHARLEGTNLRKASLENANLSNARLNEADLSLADLKGADLRAANLHGSRLSGARLGGVDLSNTNLIGANLSYSDMTDADLHHADLAQAHLSRATLEGANLVRAILHGADLVGTVFNCADLSNVRGLMQSQLDDACGEKVTGLPFGLVITACPKRQTSDGADEEISC
jgi:uncharacterized protein YjbI with pentapeptide repeats